MKRFIVSEKILDACVIALKFAPNRKLEDYNGETYELAAQIQRILRFDGLTSIPEITNPNLVDMSENCSNYIDGLESNLFMVSESRDRLLSALKDICAKEAEINLKGTRTHKREGLIIVIGVCLVFWGIVAAILL